MKRKLALLLILKIPTIKKAVELLNSIGVLKLTAVNFKKTNIMKKMLFGLIATVMLSVSANAQTITNEDLRLQLSKSMVSLVNDLKPNYKSGMTYKDFTNVILAGNTNSTIPTTGDNLLRKAHSFLEKNTTENEILKTYNGQEMADAYYFLKDSKDAKEGAIKVFGNEIIEKTKFGQNMLDSRVACCKWLSNAWNWVWGHKDEIIEIICLFTTLC